jgi:hypothetical protein
MPANTPGRRFLQIGQRLGVALCVMVLSGCGGGGGTEGPAPVSLDAVFPVRGSAAGGTRIQLTGQGFSSSTQVKVDGQACEDTTALSSSSLTCVTPAHEQGSVDIQVFNADGGLATRPAAYTYRPSGSDITSFGILSAAPFKGIYPSPYSAKLESVITGFDLSTVTRSWVVDDKPYNEGDTVTLDAGSHTVSLTVRDATGDSDQASYTIVVGELTDPGTSLETLNETSTLSPGTSISVVNTGFLPLLNPRLVGVGKPDYVDWPGYLNSLARLGNLPMDASESSRARLLEAAWKDLSNATVHVCSPGREAENIYDPVLLVRGYGSECCSNASRALAYLGALLDIPARVRTTAAHEFPEFTVGGRMFVLDPDLRFRFWGEGQLPLSAWTTDSTPVSLENVTRYTAETPKGEYYEAQPGGTLPIWSSTQHPEQSIRAFYFSGIVGESVWGYHEAFSNSSHVLYPNEKMAFQQSSAYVPLQWRNSDGSPADGNHAPAVGKVVFKRIWSASGPRAFQQDDEGHRTIPLNDLPYPVQDLVFHFSKPITPEDMWLTSEGNTYRIGDFTANTWTVSAQQLRVLRHLSDLMAVVPPSQNLVAVDIGMQFNPGIFGDPGGAVSVNYADDSGTCQRQLSVTTSSGTKELTFGSSLCDSQAPQRVETSYSLQRGKPGVSVISAYGNSYQGTWGLAAAAGVRAYAEISLPRTAGLSGILRATNEGLFADWQIHDGSNWVPLSATDVATSQWIALPATSSPTTRLRATLRQAPAANSTYLSYLSLIEGRDMTRLPFVSASTD